MNSKGFTLIELIGIVVILSLVFLVTYPNFVSLSKTEDNKKYELMVKDLCLAGESYINTEYKKQNPNQLKNEGDNVTILISDLITKGYVDKKMKDVKTGNLVSSRTLTYKVNSDKTLECSYN